MINPNICKRVIAKISYEQSSTGRVYMIAEYKGIKLDLHLKKHLSLKPGNRYVYLKYSILNDCYYLTDYNY